MEQKQYQIPRKPISYINDINTNQRYAGSVYNDTYDSLMEINNLIMSAQDDAREGGAMEYNISEDDINNLQNKYEEAFDIIRIADPHCYQNVPDISYGPVNTDSASSVITPLVNVPSRLKTYSEIDYNGFESKFSDVMALVDELIKKTETDRDLGNDRGSQDFGVNNNFQRAGR